MGGKPAMALIDPREKTRGMDGYEWITAFAERLGVVTPDEATIETLLALAASAAHQSERVAAPIACYLVGRAGFDPASACEVAARVNLSTP
jgi:hypothetical protein